MPLDFSAIPVSSRLGRALRAPLKLIPEGAVVRILQGPLRGARWIVGSSTAGCWLGSYELRKVRLFASSIQSGMTVFDIGAHAGYYTLIASRLVGGSGRVVAFAGPSQPPIPPPSALAQPRLQRHGLELAISDRAGVVRFDGGAGSYLGRLDPAGTKDVRTTTLDELVTGRSVPSPHVLKLDIEGAESDALVGAAAILGRPALRSSWRRTARGSTIHASRSCVVRDTLSDLSKTGIPVLGRAHRPTFAVRTWLASSGTEVDIRRGTDRMTSPSTS